jgi:hypothetical protein
MPRVPMIAIFKLDPFKVQGSAFNVKHTPMDTVILMHLRICHEHMYSLSENNRSKEQVDPGFSPDIPAEAGIHLI